MATKQSIINAIIDNYDVTEVTVTSGNNGYPSNLRSALLVYDWDDAQAIADTYPGVGIASLRKRDGWSFWESEGSTCEPYDMYGDFCINGRVIESQEDIIGVFSLDDPDFITELPADKLASYLECAAKLLRDLANLEEGQFIGNEDTDDCDNYHSYCTYDKCQVAYSEDVWQYHIAITFNLISDEEEEE